MHDWTLEVTVLLILVRLYIFLFSQLLCCVVYFEISVANSSHFVVIGSSFTKYKC